MWTTKVDSSSTSVNKVSKYDNLLNSCGNVCGCITAILRCPFPVASASAVHSEIPVTPVHTCSDLSVFPLLKSKCALHNPERGRKKEEAQTKVEWKTITHCPRTPYFETNENYQCAVQTV